MNRAEGYSKGQMKQRYDSSIDAANGRKRGAIMEMEEEYSGSDEGNSRLDVG